MSNDNTPTTITRFFDPTVWGLRKNQLVVFFTALIITSGSILIKVLVFPDSLLVSVIGFIITVLAWLVFIKIGLDRDVLYHTELLIRFAGRRVQGEEKIQKYNEKDQNKVRNFNRIKRILLGQFVEFWPVGRGNNWGGYLKIDSYKPLDLAVFEKNAESFLSMLPDGTIIKTILAIRRDLNNNSADQFKHELKKQDLHPIIRDNLYEHVEQCEVAQTRKFTNYMFINVPYTTNARRACETLDNLLSSCEKTLREMEVESHRLKTDDEIYAMFDELVTHNMIIRRGIE
jgi:hypothetical protein